MLDVVIIGAGAAGIAAADHLRKAGASSLILEARDRIGGHVQTDISITPCTPLRPDRGEVEYTARTARYAYHSLCRSR